MTDQKREKDLRKLAAVKYAILPIREMARLHIGRELFLKILDDELRDMGGSIPEGTKDKWILSEDLGRLVNLWKATLDEFTLEGPALARDILALHELIDARPRVYSKDVIKDLMDPTEAYAMPILDYRKNHLATLIHVGPEAKEFQIRKLARSLVRDPSGMSAPV